MDNLTEDQIAELACSYAALILHDDDVAITADKITSLIKAAGVYVPPYYPPLFERVLKGRKMEDLLSAQGSVAAPSGPGPAAGGEKADAGAAEEEEEEEEEEQEEDMGGLFGDDEEGY
eukprot:CAMPEP_0174258416 /NCGR_PEP_ID=MMETSP0439-20130205/7410_1 /TAXON_ID=0 /ORGANISM="Stereomyxa ramosa, Strain Chinc5" /LENGTH=117 /DNA_ID=CAMNT_0015341911 /DNA_START=74 /DNA_END=427 /DNA_ORIENTATION=-